MRFAIGSITLALILPVGVSAQDNVVTTKSGLKYIERKVGTGDIAVTGSTAETHYNAWVAVDGKKVKLFDSSFKRGRPFSFKVGAYKETVGFEEGVTGMKVGGRRELFIPPELGFGSREIGKGLVPPNSTLIFEVELLKVTQQFTGNMKRIQRAQPQ